MAFLKHDTNINVLKHFGDGNGLFALSNALADKTKIGIFLTDEFVSDYYNGKTDMALQDISHGVYDLFAGQALREGRYRVFLNRSGMTDASGEFITVAHTALYRVVLVAADGSFEDWQYNHDYQQAIYTKEKLGKLIHHMAAHPGSVKARALEARGLVSGRIDLEDFPRAHRDRAEKMLNVFMSPNWDGISENDIAMAVDHLLVLRSMLNDHLNLCPSKWLK